MVIFNKGRSTIIVFRGEDKFALKPGRQVKLNDKVARKLLKAYSRELEEVEGSKGGKAVPPPPPPPEDPPVIPTPDQKAGE